MAEYEKYFWSLESWGEEYPPDNAEEIVAEANSMIKEFAESLDDNVYAFIAVREYSDELWEKYCATGKLTD